MHLSVEAGLSHRHHVHCRKPSLTDLFHGRSMCFGFQAAASHLDNIAPSHRLVKHLAVYHQPSGWSGMRLLDGRHCCCLLLICERTVGSKPLYCSLMRGPAAASHMGDAQWAAQPSEGDFTVAWSFWPPHVSYYAANCHNYVKDSARERSIETIMGRIARILDPVDLLCSGYWVTMKAISDMLNQLMSEVKIEEKNQLVDE
ncbi:uncharacterized protein LOC124702786 isoform X2 [Lolium rigidum]|uniref:uncharacterized protein LOC124702786 isoform X2 n=1 Tax=Lolium rigidum TaxID=89674 RepID=UPI001F5CCA41|nr:uncharacterized protein LOC124702786 isoform X2 [Lolium rigidum]